MSLSVIGTCEEQLVGASVVAALRESLEECGSAVLLVPSFEQALDAQRELSLLGGLSLGVAVDTPFSWARQLWETWGDGRALASNAELLVLAREVLTRATDEERGPLELSAGLVRVLGRLANVALPWLPLGEDGALCEDACDRANLTRAERLLLGLVGKLRGTLAKRGYVSRAEAFARVPALLKEASARVAPVVLAGFTSLNRAERELVLGMASLTQVSLVGRLDNSPACAQTKDLLVGFGQTVLQVDAGEAQPIVRDAHLASLAHALFTGQRLEASSGGQVRLLLAAGPAAEAELIARAVEELLEDGADSVVVAVPDTVRARRELLPKLMARKLPVRFQGSRALLDCPAAQAFFSFAHMVAHLAELEDTWPEPVQGIDGQMAQLGDMSWWPPRELSDFLLSDIAHVDASQAWRMDAQWRGNRLLSPAALLAQLQSERETSAPVARATTELLRGRVGTAASRLLAPYVEQLVGEQMTAQALYGSANEARSVLQAILGLAGTLRLLGVTADPAAGGAVSLGELVETCEWAAEGLVVAERSASTENGMQGLVRVMSTREAAQLPAGSVDALVICGLTTVESPISAGEGLVDALLEQLEVEPAADPMARARAQFRALVELPRRRLVLERALNDADAKPAYPSVMLSELLEVYGMAADGDAGQGALPAVRRGETLLGENLAPQGSAPHASGADDPAPAGRLTSSSRAHVFVPQEGSETLPDGKPILSASQIETYLDCPYKWFSLRRLRLGTVDAGHGGMEMGTFAHRVLEVTHRELLLRALEVEGTGLGREELLAAIEANPVRHIAGSRVDAGNLELATELLDLEFELHQQHMYMVRKPRVEQQLLVAHSAAEWAQQDRLHEDLRSSLAFQTRILEGFEPRLFEWSFGRRGNLVSYAGAYITGTVDRIDVSPHGSAVIIDYKHKNPVGFAAEYDALQEGVLEGTTLPRRVQSLIYAQVARRAFEGRLDLVGTVYLSTKSPHALAGAANENVVDQVFGRVSAQRMPRVCVPAGANGASGMVELLDRTEELVAEQVRQMMAGNVEARPRDKGSCDFCPVMQCERRMAR